MTKTSKESMIQEVEVQFPGYYKRPKHPSPSNDDDDDDGKEVIPFDLAGTLRIPSSNIDAVAGDETTTTQNKKTILLPAALIIPGSGPIDRDGNAIIGFPIPNMVLNTQNLLAEALVVDVVQQEGNNNKNNNQKAEGGGGMVVLCYDKRGIGKSVCPSNKDLYYEGGMLDLVDDAVSAYKFLVDHPLVDSSNIILIGHSEGAILLPLVVEQIKSNSSSSPPATATATSQLPPPKGLIFLAGFGETLDNAAKNQRELMLKEVQEESGLQGWLLRRVLTKEKLDRQYDDFLSKVQDTDDDYDKQYCGLVKVPLKWYREHLEWDAAESLSNCESRMLAITGGKDVQVKSEYCMSENATQIAPNAIELETHVVEKMTHILRSMDGEPKILNINKEYPKLGKQPLDSGMLQIIIKWIQSTVLN